MEVCPAPCAHLRGLQLAASTPHLTGFQRGTTWLPAEMASSYFEGVDSAPSQDEGSLAL